MPWRRSDDVVQRDIVDALIGDVRIDATDLNVQVLRGRVHLRGRVPSLFVRQTAEEIAARIKGVVAVVNELEIGPVQPPSDTQIAAEVRGILLRDPLVEEESVEVTVSNGVVRLAGVVPSEAQQAAAGDDASMAAGVKGVVNHLSVRPVAERTDEEIADAVQDAVLRELLLGPSEVSVQVENGVVRLRGSVWTSGVRFRAEEMARLTPGVVDVINDIQVVS